MYLLVKQFFNLDDLWSTSSHLHLTVPIHLELPSFSVKKYSAWIKIFGLTTPSKDSLNYAKQIN